MHSLDKSKKHIGKSKNRTRKTWGGAKPVTNAAVKTALKKLEEYKSMPDVPITYHQLGNSLPLVILAAKKAIIVANDNPGDENARKLAEIKIKTADYIANEINTRKKWKNERNLNSNSLNNSGDWYNTGKDVFWRLKDINESAKSKMADVLAELPEQVGLLPVEDEESEMGKSYRSGKKRFERRAQGLPSTSPSPEK